MTDRKPDFYRVRFAGSDPTKRQYLIREPSAGVTHSAAHAAGYLYLADAERALSKITAPGFRIVHVYVKVTRRPKRRDFAWALRRMREGKRVRRAGQSTHYLCAKSYGGDLLPNCIRYNGPGGCGDVDDITTQDLTACDWQLYEAP